MRIFLLVNIFSLSLTASRAQNPDLGKLDTLEAHQNLVIGDSLMNEGKYKQAANYFEKSSKGFKKNQLYTRYVVLLNKFAKGLMRSGKLEDAEQTAELALVTNSNYLDNTDIRKTNEVNSKNILGVISHMRGDYDMAKDHFTDALEVNLSLSGDNDQEIASSYNNLGIFYLYIGEYDKSIEYHQAALKTRLSNTGANPLNISASYNNLAQVYIQKNEFDKTIGFYKKALEIKIEVLGYNHIEVASAYNNLGTGYDSKGANDLALEYLTKALQIRKKNLDSDHPDIGQSYDNIGLIYRQEGENDLALEYFQKGLTIREKKLHSNHPILATSYHNLGSAYLNKNDHVQALEYLFKALEIRRSNLGEIHTDVAESYNKIGTIYAEMGDREKALKHYASALNILEKIVGKNHPAIGSSYINIALSLKKADRDIKALKYLDDAIIIYTKHQGVKHSHLATAYNEVGEVYVKMKKYDIALKYFQLAIFSNIIDFKDTTTLNNPIATESLADNTLVKSLQLKAEALFIRSEYQNDQSDINLALETYKLCDRLIDRIRESHLRYNDKVTLGKIASDIYKGAIDVSYKLYFGSNNTNYLKQVHYFAEKGKASVLSENLYEQEAKKFSNLPDSLLQFEKSLKIDLSFYQSQVNEMSALKDGHDTVKINSYKSKIFSLNYSLDSLTESLEKNYPNYYNLKYQKNTLSIDQIQEKLSTNEALLEYFEGDSVLYVFSITKDKFETFSIPKDTTFLSVSKRFTSNFRKSETIGSDNFYYNFKSDAYFLYQQLLQKPISQLNKEIDRLIIVPSSKLSVLPWDILIQDNKGNNFQKLSYVFKKYAISYAHSASLLFRDVIIDNTAKKGVLAFAPNYSENKNNEMLAGIDQVFRDEVVPLKWNEPEVLAINALFEGDMFLASEATEKKFKEESGNYQVLHLAMHALIDHHESMQSKLVFTQDNDSIEDGMLHTYELFNMNISAQMVVLSACNTGLGKLEEGEGVMSLARAFSYAGCPSVVMSHWNANDQATSKIMTSFYEYLSEGDGKDVALQKAKMDFLKNANEIDMNPFYWGSFVVLGDTSPIKKSNYSWILILLVTSLALLLGYWMLARKTKTT